MAKAAEIIGGPATKGFVVSCRVVLDTASPHQTMPEVDARFRWHSGTLATDGDLRTHGFCSLGRWSLLAPVVRETRSISPTEL